jgi:hypothetical protein
MAQYRFGLIALLSCFLAFGQPGGLPQNVKAARSVFIDNETGDSSVLDSAHIVLASTDLRWKDDRSSADLVFHFGRNAESADRTVKGNEIHIAIKNTYTPEVTARNGTVIWKNAVDFDPSNVRTENTERSWLGYLHRHPAGKLVTLFLKSRSE